MPWRPSSRCGYPPTVPSSRRPIAIIGALTFALGLSACSGERSEPTDVDAARLASLVAAPPFDASALQATWVAEEADAAAPSSAVLAYRGSVRTEAPLPPATPADAALGEAWSRSLPTARAVLGEMAQQGWVAAWIACAPPASASDLGTVDLVATATLDDGSTAAVAVQVGADEVVRATAYAPYHDERDDPWGLEALDEPSCIDGAAPPTESTASGAEPELGRMVPLP